MKKKKAAKKAALLFFTTFSKIHEAENFAKLVVQEKLAACINILPPMTSYYFWNGQQQKDQEFLIIGKTTSQGFKKLKSRIKEFHSYQVPELISMNITDGLPDYLKWLHNQVS